MNTVIINVVDKLKWPNEEVICGSIWQSGNYYYLFARTDYAEGKSIYNLISLATGDRWTNPADYALIMAQVEQHKLTFISLNNNITITPKA